MVKGVFLSSVKPCIVIVLSLHLLSKKYNSETLTYISHTLAFNIILPCLRWGSNQVPLILNSQGTKVEKMLTLAPERYTAKFCMVAKVILWCIWNHCIADSIEAVNFLRKPSKDMSKYYFSKWLIFLLKKFGIEKYWVHIINDIGVDLRGSGGHLRILLIGF